MERTPAETARSIAATHLPDAPEGARYALSEAIRWAIVRGQIDAIQPPELKLARAPAIVHEIVNFIDDYLRRMRGSSYAEQANALQACRTRVLAAHAIPVAAKKPAAKADELKRGAGA